MSKADDYKLSLDLVSRIEAGDRDAETEMIKQFHRGLLFILSRSDNYASDVEDIAQETWHVVIQKIRAGEIKDPTKLSPFIVQTGKYQQLMSFRRGDKFRSDIDPETLHDSTQTPQAAIDREINAKIVRQLIKELPKERDQELMQRFYLHEESIDWICKDTGLKRDYFNRVIFRARQRFKELWQAYQDEKPDK